MADLEELVVRIRADTAQLEREMKKAQGVVEQSSRGMKGALGGVADQARALLPALSVAAVVAFGRSALQSADHLNDLALRTGFAGSTLSALNVKLLQTGSSVDDFSGAVNRMNNLVGEAAKGTNKEAIRAFDELGLSVKKLQALAPEEQFYEIAQALGQTSNQATFTNSGIAIFGRSFSNIAPLIKETSGNVREFTEEQKKLGNALTEDQLKKIDEFGDKWTAAVEQLKLAMINATPALQLYLDGLTGILNLPANAFKAGQDLARAAGIAAPEQFGPAFKPGGNKKSVARGSNRDLLGADSIRKAREELEKYNLQLQREYEFAMLSPKDAAARKAYYDTLEKAQKAGIKNAEQLANANAQVAASTYEMAQAQSEAARFAGELKDQFSQTATDIILGARSASDALKGLAEAFAKMIIQKHLLGGLTDSLFGAPGSGGGGLLGSLFSGGSLSQSWGFATQGGYGPFQGFAEGGQPPIGVPSMVGERGPELFVPHSAGTIVPNHAIGGNSVTIVQNFSIGAGVQGTIRAELLNLMPVIKEHTKTAVFDSINRGGSEAKIVNRRN